MKKIDPQKKIILDADVVIHFLKGGHIGMLSQIYPNKLFMPDVVFEETFHGREKTEVENLFRFGFVQELKLKTDIRIIKEYKRLSQKLGRGESACMAYCRYNDDVIASSNLRDIKLYCEEFEITYLTTLDFLAQAYQSELLSEQDCDYFIYKADPNHKIPYRSIKKYIESLS